MFVVFGKGHGVRRQALQQPLQIRETESAEEFITTITLEEDDMIDVNSIIAHVIKEIIYDLLEKFGSRIVIGMENFFDNSINTDFYKINKDRRFKLFRQTVLRRYYTEDYFTEVNGKTFPAFCIPSTKIEGSSNEITKYDALLLADKKNSGIEFNENEHQNYKKRYYASYSQIVKKRVVAGDRPGLMLDRLKCDKNGNVESFQVYLGTYAENVYTSHVLEYELYRAYKKFQGKNVKDYWDKIVKFMKTRNEIDKSVRADKRLNISEEKKAFLTSGEGRHSLLGVQMLVLMREDVKSENEKKERYRLFLTKRSKKMAIAPEYYQLIPSGGFEIFSDCQQEYSEKLIRDNLSVGCAVFREYLEEIFRDKNFKVEDNYNLNAALKEDERIQEIEKMLKSGDASFEFLGCVVDLTVLRYELSFVLVIKNSNYWEKNFKEKNKFWTHKFIDDVYLDNFEQKEKKYIWNNLHWSSAAMWKLFSQTDLYQELKGSKTNSK